MKKKLDPVEVLCEKIEKELRNNSSVRKEFLTKKFKTKEPLVLKALAKLNLQGKVKQAGHGTCPDIISYIDKKGRRVNKKCWHPDYYESKIYEKDKAVPSPRFVPSCG